MLTAVIVVAGCSSPTSTAEYHDLEVVAHALRKRVRTLEAEVEAAAQSIDKLAAPLIEVASLRLELEEMEAEKSGLRDQLPALLADVESLEAERDNLRDQVETATQELHEAMRKSSAFGRWVRATNTEQGRWKCAKSIVAAFRELGATGVTEASLMESAPTPSDLFDEGREALGVAIDLGCPNWWLEDTEYWSEEKIKNSLCRTVDLATLGRQPDRVRGDCLTGWGRVVQFDLATGPCVFHANVATHNVAWYSYDLRVEFKDPNGVGCDWLDGLVEGDEFRWYAIGDGVVTYETSLGGTNSIPSVKIFSYGG